MPPNALNNLFVRTQLIQIRRDATSEPMPAIPIQSKSFYLSPVRGQAAVSEWAEANPRAMPAMPQ
jgi:hypothetical protein